ncbi:DUF523 domain-containing protein [Corallincola spongiicola]|uniref:DUF523 domain-containing protein n=1 Tax=Corallincola spongiicola TaxID=2520508 RepID=A0ABY1WL07_9GAMM|nr:DUF523 domain-containing protein [Corallincola spongiicola]TAA41035.1 DUF523 domain-containing protein [Corallincola spongiicola]
MEKILISACLLGDRVRYNGEIQLCEHPLLKRWQAEGRLVKVCPEVVGGLPVPRPAAEQQPGGRVITQQGVDVTAEFEAGATLAVKLAQQQGIRLALMKARSPSCGSGHVYDGAFQGRLIAGDGVTVSHLRRIGVQLFDETQLDALAAELLLCESGKDPSP